MAATNVSLAKMELNTGLALPAAAALDATEGAYVAFNGQDTKTVLVLSGSGTAVVKAGNGLQGVADLQVEVSANGTLLELESGAFKLVSGPHKGTVHITGPATVKVQAALLV